MNTQYNIISRTIVSLLIAVTAAGIFSTISTYASDNNEPGTAKLGNRVWLDQNRDGIQGANEPGVSGIAVAIKGTGVDNQDFSATTTTDADGYYEFSNLNAGDYLITFSNLPKGFGFTSQFVGDDSTLDSNANPENGQSEPLWINNGKTNHSIDAGLVNNNSGVIGDKVFLDNNGNGLQDEGDSGVANVTVTLNGPNNLEQTTITDENGNYLFEQLMEGEYMVTFSNLPENFVFTLKDAGDGTLDSDADESTGKTDLIYLNHGEKNITIDAGLVDATPTPLPAPEPVEPVTPVEPVEPQSPVEPAATPEPTPEPVEPVTINNPVIDPTVVTKVPRTGGVVSATLSTAVLAMVVGGASIRKKIRV